MTRLTQRGSSIAAILAILILAPGCGDDGSGDGGDPDAGGSDAGPRGEWKTLISSEWTVPDGGGDEYQCVRLTVNQDMYITGFRSMAPLGTHHSVLTVGAAGQPDGIFPCDASTNHDAMIYGSGIGTNDVALPEGVAMPIRAGQQLLLNLHLYNLADAPLSGTSGVEIQTIPASEVVHEAEVILMGKLFTLLVPPGESTQVGTCVMNGDVTLFTVSPHMHQLGTHMMIIAERDGQEDVTLHDAPYSFEDQRIYPIEPIEMKQGDRVKVHCSYNNPFKTAIPYGDSSDREMCFGTTYRYPARGATIGIVCAN